jgi:uncharacterized protein YggE
MFTSSGEGQVTGVPDEATVNIGIVETATTVADAKDKANIKVNKTIESIKALGISENDIKTTNFSVSPNYGNQDVIMPMMYPARDTNTITGYTINQNLEIKIKKTENVNKVIDTTTKAGANLVGGVNFTFSNELQKKLEEKARKEAVDKAKEKAQSLANVSGLRLGKIINVVENSSFPRIMPMMAVGKGEAVADNTQTTVTPGENTVTISVTIYYETH